MREFSVVYNGLVSSETMILTLRLNNINNTPVRACIISLIVSLVSFPIGLRLETKHNSINSYQEEGYVSDNTANSPAVRILYNYNKKLMRCALTLTSKNWSLFL